MQRFGQGVSGASLKGTGLFCAAAALLAVLGMSVHNLPDVRSGGLSNPDTYMRLVRLRDMLHAGTALDVVARDGSGHGTVLHWSHLIDSLLSLIALPFSLVLRPDDALHGAALVFGPLGIAALGIAVAWAADPFADRKWLFLGAVLPALSPAIASYGVAGVVHHHVAIVLVTVACWGLTARLLTGRAPATAGIALGTWAALGVWFTPESVPLTMMAFGALGVAWITAPDRARDEITLDEISRDEIARDEISRDEIARAIGLTGVSFAAVTALALLVDPPVSGLGALDIDRLSLLFAGMALAVGATAAGVWAINGLLPARGPRIAAACAIGLLFCGIWALSCHGALFRDNMLLDERQRDAMFGHIDEMLPVGGVLSALHFLLTGTLATALVIATAARRRSLLLHYAAVCLCGLLVLGWMHVRFAAYPEVAGATALPIALTMATQATLRWHPIGQSFARLATILLFVQVPYLGEMPDVTASARAAPMALLPACAVSDAIAMLASHPGAVLLADVNDTPELLYRTPVRTVGSLYHRDVPGFLRLRAAWRAQPSDTVPPEIDAAEVSLVLACKTSARSSLVEDIPTATLLDQLRSGHPPPWLAEIDENPVSGQALYAVVRPEDRRRSDQVTAAVP